MKSMIVVALALVAVAVAVPVEEPVKTLQTSIGFETKNGITRDEVGEPKSALDEENKPHVIVVRDTYGNLDADGTPQTTIRTTTVPHLTPPQHDGFHEYYDDLYD